MNCFRAFEIDLEDLLLEPDSAELREFEAHCETGADCTAELGMHRGMLGRLSGEVEAKEHPSDALLLHFRRDPEGLSRSEREGILAHLRDCAPCDNAYSATLALVPEPQRSAVTRLLETLRSWLVPSAMPAWAPTAIAIVLVAGFVVNLDPLGLREPELVFRGVPSDYSAEVEVAPDDRGSLSLYGLSGEDIVLLRLEMPAALHGSELDARVSLEDGGVVFEGRVDWEKGVTGAGVVVLSAGDLERDTYVVEVETPSGGKLVYRVDVHVR
jgi:hypothetical protein